jgi:hypothetical protein
MTCEFFAGRLAVLADRLPGYYAKLRDAGFTCGHVNDDWIESRCSIADVVTHKRYLIEFAREVFATGNSSPDFGDEQNCMSPWLNELKAKRFAKYGDFESLWRNGATRHLAQLSPGWREFFRVKESSALVDQMHVADQMANYVHRWTEEKGRHRDMVAICNGKMPPRRDEASLQAFFADQLAATFKNLGLRIEATLIRNQVLRCDEQVMVVVFDLSVECLLVLEPIVVLSGKSASFIGNMSVGFRLMRPTALRASKFEFGRDVVIRLQELLPNKFNGYGRFENSQEFCLNILAWTTALGILLPDALQTLRTGE